LSRSAAIRFSILYFLSEKRAKLRHLAYDGRVVTERPGKKAVSALSFASAEELTQALSFTYLADEKTALVLWLALSLGRPVLVEGPAGVGKTDLARAMSDVLVRRLVRLQCYEGLDESRALYEWDYGKQILFSQLLRDTAAKATKEEKTLRRAAEKLSSASAVFFSREFLVERPLLQAITSEHPVVLLVDEVDRADPEFEALLLEVLAENQVTIPELGTFRATQPPLVILTTNGTREMTDALRRRCLHLYLDYPPPSRELKILELRVPGIDRMLAARLTEVVAKLRTMSLEKHPSIAESIDWAKALMLLGRGALDAKTAEETLGLVLKHEEDRKKVAPEIGKLVTAPLANPPKDSMLPPPEPEPTPAAAAAAAPGGEAEKKPKPPTPPPVAAGP
jgi:MoxR-like ATPase